MLPPATPGQAASWDLEVHGGAARAGCSSLHWCLKLWLDPLVWGGTSWWNQATGDLIDLQVLVSLVREFPVAGEPGASHTETSPAGALQCRTKFRRAPSGFSNNPIRCHIFAWKLLSFRPTAPSAVPRVAFWCATRLSTPLRAHWRFHRPRLLCNNLLLPDLIA